MRTKENITESIKSTDIRLPYDLEHGVIIIPWERDASCTGKICYTSKSNSSLQAGVRSYLPVITNRRNSNDAQRKYSGLNWNTSKPLKKLLLLLLRKANLPQESS
ncbi:hypothetical protein ACOME3_000536 [Neoechinorhynchus agilis]